MQTYRPNKWIDEGLSCQWVQMCHDLRRSLELGWRLFVRDFSAKYRQSLLGAAWVVIFPAFTVGVFVLLNQSGVLQVRESGVPYPVFALFGLTLWSLFAGLVSAIAGIVGQAGSLIAKIHFPRIALVHSPVLSSLAELAVRLALVAAVMVYYGVRPHGSFVLLPLLLLPLCCLAIGTGMAFSILGGVFRDLPNVLSLLLTVMLFATPVMYPMPDSGLLCGLNRFNPLYYLIEVPRGVFFGGRLEYGAAYAWSVLLSLAVLLGGWRFYHVAMNRIVEKL
ncbi:MAG TPA: ABC transporter permease [Syntrophales bacterium]|nr:ABC transporter permease [Syntrophales bacterium]